MQGLFLQNQDTFFDKICGVQQNYQFTKGKQTKRKNYSSLNRWKENSCKCSIIFQIEKSQSTYFFFFFLKKGLDFVSQNKIF